MNDCCPQGHDRTALGWTSQGRCAECERVRDRARKKRPPRGLKTPTAEPPVVSVLGLTDGWEPEFGPLEPLPEGYVDPVALERLGFGYREKKTTLRSSIEGHLGSTHHEDRTKTPLQRGAIFREGRKIGYMVAFGR